MNKGQRYTLITGAANGLGRSLSVECAIRKMNLVLADVDEAGLQKLANFIRDNYAISVHCIVADVSTDSGREMILNSVKQMCIRIKILINNAGTGGTSYFEQRTPDQLHRQIALNVTAPTLLTRMFIEDLKRSGREAFVLNVASLAGFFHLPGKQVYGATKAYLLSLSRSLRKEFAEERIFFSVLCPGGMNTNIQMMLRHRNCSWLSQLSVLPPEKVANTAIKALLGKKEVIVPGRLNSFFLFASRLIPSFITDHLSRREMRNMMIHTGPSS